ncbi:MAG: tryptophan synthase subunit alpha, partial [Gemmatimonadota bacterium]
MTGPESRTARGRIARAFAGRTAFIPFLSSGYPRPTDTPRLLAALAEAGADIIELGVPFSDPLADGPTIQRASWEALGQGVSLDSTLTQLSAISADLPPVVLFSYLNPILRMGVEPFLERRIGISTALLPPGQARRLCRKAAWVRRARRAGGPRKGAVAEDGRWVAVSASSGGRRAWLVAEA